MLGKDQVFPLLLTQLTVGCDSLNCTCENCRSCPNFKYENDDPITAAFNLCQANSPEKNVCPNLSILLRDPKILELLIKISDTIHKFIRQQHLSREDHGIFQQMFTNTDAFCHIMLGGDGVLQHDNLLFDNSLIEDFYKSVDERPMEIRDCAQKFEQLIKSLINKPCTVSRIRGLLLLFMFPCFVKTKSFISVFNTISCFTRAETCVLFVALTNYPSLLPIILKSSHSFIDDYIKNNSTIHPHSTDMHVIATTLQIFFTANKSLKKPLPSSAFYNESFCKCLDPRCEAELLQVADFSYVITPAILTIIFKTSTLEQ